MIRFGFLIALIWLVTLMPACNDNSSPNEYAAINSWILENMEVYYLWNDQIPGRVSKKLYPEDYFSSLLYSKDRFSWIQDNFIELMNSLSGVNTEAGYDFNLLRLYENSSEVIGYITYIKPGSPAETANLKRGDYFSRINDQQLTVDNYLSLLNKTAEPHTLGKAIISNRTIIGVENVSLTVVEYKENPILLDTVYSLQGKQIGYIVYNFFARDNGDGSITYEKELNQLFDKFKQHSINELIIDLRYNGGGTIITAEAIASMISNHGATDLFGIEEYNAYLHMNFLRIYGAKYNERPFWDFLERYNSSYDAVLEKVAINKLTGLNRVYFIVSARTASASELLINGLKPYMEVILVGGKTVGKNVGSFTIYEEDPVKQQTNKWGMQPIVVKNSNSVGFSDYTNGFSPDIELYESTEEIRPLGDTDELLLSATLNHIFGGTQIHRINKSGRGTDIVGSSIDKTPARQNMFITPRPHQQ